MMIPGCQAITSPHKLHVQHVVSVLLSGKPNLMLTSHQIWNPLKEALWDLQANGRRDLVKLGMDRGLD
jgi:hypothetical protein